jgi:GNAT superfamily N-acetyltransferase
VIAITASADVVISFRPMASTSTRVEVIRTHLELRDLAELRPARPPAEPVALRLHRPIRAAEYRALYTLVGQRWLWRDRLVWTDAELDRYLSSATVQVWTLNVRGETAGYFELQRHADDTIEVMYFGLVEAFIGRGLGGWLLTRAAEEAFGLGARRLILNTCTLDSPRALPNYLARGFVIVREDRYVASVPSRPHLTLERTTEPA